MGLVVLRRPGFAFPYYRGWRGWLGVPLAGSLPLFCNRCGAVSVFAATSLGDLLGTFACVRWPSFSGCC